MASFFENFYKKVSEKFVSSQKSRTFASAKTKGSLLHKTLGYGVMVTLQILVLPFLVRVRVPQQGNFRKEVFLLYIPPKVCRMANIFVNLQA